MARTRHTDPHEALHDLLDQHERAQARNGEGRRLTAFVSQSFATPAVEETFASVIRSAEAAGAVSLEMDKGDMAHLMKRVILRDPASLYGFLSRRPRGDMVEDALARLTRAVEDRADGDMAREARYMIDRIGAAWKARRNPHRLTPENHATTLDFVLAWAAVASRDPEDRRDLRTFSRQVLGNSKLVEQQMARILAEARQSGAFPEDLDDEDVRAALGLEKFAHLVEVAGDHPEVERATRAGGHVGLHPALFEAIEPVSIRALVTVENYASFNRAYRETAAPGVVFLYTGGWPGRAERLAIGHLSAAAERVLHWGDIDMAGAAIADAVWQAAGRDIELHLMAPELAQKHGQPASFRAIEVGEGSPARDLVTWLSGPDAHMLEQEEIDPIPVMERPQEPRRKAGMA